ncbi:MAG: hypothetical protein MZV70_60740 [Desulfobacterales bacterium]|nr:hypothetical protein [Desulfobacterales bacterium]
MSDLNHVARGHPLRFRDQLPRVPSHPARREGAKRSRAWPRWMNPCPGWSSGSTTRLTRLPACSSKCARLTDDARLLTLNQTKALFGKNSFRYREHAYVNVFLPVASAGCGVGR